MRHALLLIAALLAQGADPAISQRVDDYVRGEMTRLQIPGLALGVFRNGEIVKAQGYGVADLKSKVAISPETVFESGSMGKQFTATAILMLVEEGRIGLADSIGAYFSDRPPAWNPITIRNLLTHTSGLPEYHPNDDINPQKNYTSAQMLTLLQGLPLDFQPGEKWQYRNTNYLLLGWIIEKVTGQFWGDVLRDRIFRPLGMSSTHAISGATSVPLLATGYSAGQRRIPVIGARQALVENYQVAPFFKSTADGMLYLTVLDLAKWDAALYTDRLVKRSSLDQMWTIPRLNSGSPASGNYGFGWYINTMNGHKVIEHGGFSWGFMAHIARYVDHNLSVVVLTNLGATYANPEKIAHVVAGMYVPAVAPAELKRIQDDPRVTALVRNLIEKLSSGTPPDGWTRNEIEPFRIYLRGEGKLKALELVKHQEGTGSYTYRVMLGDFSHLLQIDFTDGRVTHIEFAPD